MKYKFFSCLAIAAVLLAGVGRALAQSRHHHENRSSVSTPPPGPEDYPAFSRFIAQRNIFNPNRYAAGQPAPVHVSTAKPLRSAPAFSFVGTMVYHKGMFAFFDGNHDEYRKSLGVSGKIGDYTVQEITLTNVVLAEGSNTLSLAVGEMMQKARDGVWRQFDESIDFSAQPEGSAGPGDASAPAATESAAPAPAGASPQMSDVLKRLMMQRQQENK